MGKHKSPLGIVYVLSNPAMPGIIKIGFTEKQDAEERAAELSRSTSVPMPFVIEYEQLVENPLQYERLIHARLDQYRISKDKEFFKYDAFEASEVIRDVLFGDKSLNILRETKYLLKLVKNYPDRWKQSEESKHLTEKLDSIIAEWDAAKKGNKNI